MPEYDSHHHVVKTTAQWKERAVEYWVVPRGCLCVELTPEHKTKLKVGEGNKYYAQLPYICEGHELEDYYTKEEIDRLLDNLNRMAIQSTEEYNSKNDLPLDGNKLGDVRFVKSASPETKIDPDVYLWNGDRWIFVGYDLVEIDLSQYLKKEEFHSYFDPVSEKVDEMYPKMHTHANKSVLDETERPYTIADKTKLDSLHNYDDTEIRELIAETGHTHWNKNVLDTITPESLWTVEDRTKFESLHNYDDSELRGRVNTLESKAHTHSNKDVLDQTTAPFTTEDKTKLDSLENYDVFVGTDGRYPGIKGLVPAPSVMDIGKFLSSSGEWELAGINTPFVGATPTTDGVIGLVPAPLMGEQSYYLRGDGTWAKVKSGGDKYKAGEGIYILSGEIATDTFPFKVYSRAGHLEQYIIYGNTGGVGEAMTGGVYGVNITITDEHGNSSNTSIILPEKISLGDYIDYGRQVFVHMRTNVSSLISSVDPSYNWRYAIRPNGSIQFTDIGAYGSNPQVTSLVELEPGITYELYHQCDYSSFANYMNLNVYDTEQNRTRTIHFYDPVGNVPTIIALASNEKYIRLTYEHADRYPYTLIRVKAVETPITLPQIPLFPNSINTINITNTIKPAEIYVEVAEPSEDDPEDPMSDFTGIIYNDGVLDITQEDPDNLYEITVHFRENVTKTITIPEAEPYVLPPATDSTLGGIMVGDGLIIDSNGVLSIDSSDTGEYEAGEAIRFTKHTPQILPAAYQLVDYIESTGTQGIELNYVPSSSYIKYELTFSDIVFVNTDFHYLIGGYAGDAVGMRAPSIDYNFANWPNKVAVPCGRNDPITNGEIPSDMTVPHTYTLTVSNGSVSLQLDNGVVRTGSYSGDISQKVGLFCSPSYTAGDPSAIFQTSAYKFRELKIYEGSSSSNLTLIHHYYPCYRISDDVPGIYDVITDTFLTNVGTGDLIIGTITGTPVINVQHGDGLEVDANNDLNVKLGSGLSFDNNDAITVDEMTGATDQADGTAGTVPAPLTGDENKFLRGDGTWSVVQSGEEYSAGAHINFTRAGLVPAAYTQIQYAESAENSTVYLDTGYPGNVGFTAVIDLQFYPSYHRQLMGIYPGTGDYFGSNGDEHFEMGGNGVMGSSDTTQRNTVTWHHTLTSPARLEWNGVSVTDNNGYGGYNSNFKLFSPFSDYRSQVKIYSCVMYDNNDQVVRNFIPCKTSLGVVGFYDTVTELFYSGQTGSLISGPEIPPSGPTVINADEMVGADGTNAGEAGVVPAPTATDNTKFLRGDGTWAIPGSSVTYAAGDGITFTQPGMTDLGFDFDAFVATITSMHYGTKTVDSEHKVLTLTATDNDCYTQPYSQVSAQYVYTFPIVAGHVYRLTWDSSNPSVSGRIFAFENVSETNLHWIDQSVQDYLEFTAVTSGTINFRFGVQNSGNTISYSNIHFYEMDDYDPDTNRINADIAKGLEFHLISFRFLLEMD